MIERFAAAALTGLLSSRPDLPDREITRMAWDIAGQMMGHHMRRHDLPAITKPKPKRDEVEQLRLEVKALRLIVEESKCPSHSS